MDSNQHRNVKVNIGPSDHFEAGIDLQGHVKWGNDFDKIINSLNDRYKNSEITLGVRIILNNPQNAENVKNRIDNIANQFGLNEMLEPMGISWETRVEGNYFFVDLHLSGATAEQFRQQINYDKLDELASVDFTGCYDFSFALGLDPVKLLTDNLSQILDRALRIRVQGDFHSEHFKNLTNWGLLFAQKLGTHSAKHLEEMALGFKIFSVLKSASFNLNYDVNLFKEVIERTIGHKLGGDEMAQGMVSQYQMMGNGILPQGQAMAQMFIGDYVETIREFNLGSYEVHMYIPKLRLQVRADLNIPSLNGFLNENFLN